MITKNNLEITEESQEIVKARLNGSLFFANAAKIEKKLSELLENHEKVELSLINTKYIDTTGLETLEEILAGANGEKLSVVEPDEKIERLLAKSNLCKTN